MKTVRALSAAVLGVLIVLPLGPGQAQTLDQRFQDLARKVVAGVGGYTGTVQPLTGPVTLSYGPTASQRHRIATLISTGGALTRITVTADQARHATAAGLFMSTTTLQDLSVEHLIAADGVTITHDALPKGTSVMVTTDRQGSIRDALILPPSATPKAAVPRPGSRGFLDAISRFPVPVLVRENAVQDTDIFLPVTFPLGTSRGFELVRGTPPRVRGEVDCRIGRCLLVEINEETLFTGQDQTVRGAAVGHMIVGAHPLNVVSAFINLRTEIRKQGKTQVIRSILTNESLN